jgi:predicted 2-oxoglutarate/Fe(II)-dependent dioxygenase YbiX
MKNNLEDYLVIFNNALSDDICNRAVQEIDENSWRKHTYYNSENDSHEHVNGQQEFEISSANLTVTQDIMQIVYDHLLIYINSLHFPWFNKLSGYTGIRFNRYKKSTRMDEHSDDITSETRNLSVLGILNDDYVGGELVFWQDTEIQVNKGDIIIWPSNFLYPHKVNAVISGVRYSFVAWAW